MYFISPVVDSGGILYLPPRSGESVFKDGAFCGVLEIVSNDIDGVVDCVNRKSYRKETVIRT